MQRDWKAEAIKQWNRDPCGADRDSEFGSPEFFARVERERYVNYAPWLKSTIGFENYTGKRVLEVGFGLGTDHISFARAGARCFGLDLTPAHVEATRRRLLLENLPVQLIRADAESLPFEDGSFDVVYSFGVLHHTPRTQRAIDDIFRVLRPGGEAIISLYHRDSVFFWVSCVLMMGLVRGHFFRNGYRRTVSRIEMRYNSDAVPLVKVYSRRQALSLFRRFQRVDVQIQHFAFSHAGRLGLFVEKFLRRFEGAISRRFGWYLIIQARKSSPNGNGLRGLFNSLCL